MENDGETGDHAHDGVSESLSVGLVLLDPGRREVLDRLPIARTTVFEDGSEDREGLLVVAENPDLVASLEGHCEEGPSNVVPDEGGEGAHVGGGLITELVEETDERSDTLLFELAEALPKESGKNGEEVDEPKPGA